MYKIFILLLFVLSADFAYADLLTNDISNGCDFPDDSVSRYALFTLNQYTCGTGYFLPANHAGCEMCLSGAICPGGTYVFNNKNSQGIFIPSNISTNVDYGCAMAAARTANPSFRSTFTPNQHTCNTGYYMPANTDGCVICPADSYCVGGTYTFNETTPQGIVSCSPGLYAPTGMWESAQCGRILHVGEEVVYLRSTKKTSPALHVDIDNDGVADFFGNATTADVPMTRGTSRKLKVSFGGQTYSIYDDSVDIGEP